MELHFSDELQKRIYDLVPTRHRKWLVHAVVYTQRARRGYPEDFPAWDDEVTIDHIMYYIDTCVMANRDATMDDKNIVVAANIHTQQNPCRIKQKAPPAMVENEEPVELPDDVKVAMEEALEQTAEVLDEGFEAPVEEKPKVTKKKTTKKKASKKKTTKKKAKKKVSKKKVD